MVAQMNLKKFWDAQYWSAFVTLGVTNITLYFQKLPGPWLRLHANRFQSIPPFSVGHRVQS